MRSMQRTAPFVRLLPFFTGKFTRLTSACARDPAREPDAVGSHMAPHVPEVIEVGVKCCI